MVFRIGHQVRSLETSKEKSWHFCPCCAESIEGAEPQEGDVTWHHGWIQHGAPPVARGQDSPKLGIGWDGLADGVAY
jgi:hypothetical protein